MIRGLMYELLDHYLGRPPADWPAKWAAFKQQRVAAGLKALAAQQSSPADLGPSPPLAHDAGAPQHGWYGRHGPRRGAGRVGGGQVVEDNVVCGYITKNNRD